MIDIRRGWLVAGALWLLAGVAALLVPESYLPATVGKDVDEAAHAVLFAVGVVLWGFAVPRWTWAVGGLALVAAVASEWAQGALIQSRGAQWSDVQADIAGIAVALVIVVRANAAWRYENRRRVASTGRR